MYIRQTDLFWGLNQNVVNRIMATESGCLFFKHLSRALGGGLTQAYQQMAHNDMGGNHGRP